MLEVWECAGVRRAGGKVMHQQIADMTAPAIAAIAATTAAQNPLRAHLICRSAVRRLISAIAPSTDLFPMVPPRKVSSSC